MLTEVATPHLEGSALVICRACVVILNEILFHLCAYSGYLKYLPSAYSRSFASARVYALISRNVVSAL